VLLLALRDRGTLGGECPFLRARDRGEIAASADPIALAQVATAILHTLAVRSRVGASRKQLKALAATAIALICGPEGS
jgi:hypothetical protein